MALEPWYPKICSMPDSGWGGAGLRKVHFLRENAVFNLSFVIRVTQRDVMYP